MEQEKKEIIIGNGTSILNSIIVSFAGLVIGILASHGIQLPIDQQALAGVIGVIIFFIFSVINTKFKSTFFTNENDLIVNVEGLTDGQINAIQNFVNNAVEVNRTGGGEDPSLAYEDNDNGGC